MKKQLGFILILLLTTTVFSQIEVTRGKFPYNQIVEWSGKGTLLIGDDPSGKTAEINLSLLNNQGEVQWNRTIYPKSKTSHLIISEMSDYIYFVDDLELVSNQIRYNQMNQSGSVAPTKFDMLSVIRKYRYTTPNDLELREIINTPKALVFYFQLPVKDKGIIENFFVTITHHNNRVYHCQGPSSDLELVKKGIDDHFVFAGADEESISFSRYSTEGGGAYLSFFPFSPKAEPLSDLKARPAKVNPMRSSVNLIGYTGSYYLQKHQKVSYENRGKGIIHQGAYYFAVNDENDKTLKIFGQNSKGEFVALKTSTALSDKKKSRSSTLSFIQLNNQLYIIGSIDGVAAAYSIDGTTIKEVAAPQINPALLRSNPSSFQVNESKNTFIHYVNGIPYGIDTQNLEKIDTFVFKKLEK